MIMNIKAIFTKENGSTENQKVMVQKYGMMEENTLENSSMVNLVVKVQSIPKMGNRQMVFGLEVNSLKVSRTQVYWKSKWKI